MANPRIFISFDYDHDDDLRVLLVGQAKNPDSPFALADWSVKEPLTGDWKAKVRLRIRAVSQMIVVCGEYTHAAAKLNAAGEGRSSFNTNKITTATFFAQYVMPRTGSFLAAVKAGPASVMALDEEAF